HRHPKKLGLTLIGVILFPSIFRGTWAIFTDLITDLLRTISGGDRDVLMQWYRWSPKLVAWSQLDLVLIVAGFCVFYLLARRFERIADEGSVQLSGDPEAMITALLKVSRLNLTPIQWGKVTGSLLTHPTTLKRIGHIAKVGNVGEARVQELLAHHAQEEQTRRSGLFAPASDSTFSAKSNDEHYAVPSAGKNVVTTMTALRRATNNRWLLIGANVLPPALVAWLVHRLSLQGQVSLIAYVAGALLIYLLGYDWDKGFIWLLQGRMVYLGDKIRFALKPEQVLNVRIGESAPGWWNSERVYIDWRDAEHGREGTFSLYPSEPSSAGKIKNEGKALCEAVQRWRSRGSEYPVAPPLAQSLESPVLGEVTSHEIKDRLSRGKRLNS